MLKNNYNILLWLPMNESIDVTQCLHTSNSSVGLSSHCCFVQ